MAPPKSDVWKYFIKQNNQTARCNLCHKVLKNAGGNTSNLKSHLRQKHSAIYAEKSRTHGSVIQVQEHVQETVSTPGTSSMSNITNEPEAVEEIQIAPAPSTSRQHQSSITRAIKNIESYALGGTKNTKISHAIAFFIIKDSMPFSVVEGTGFRHLMKEVTPLYKVPTRNTFKSIIDTKYETVSNLYKNKLKTVKCVTLTVDIWTDLQMKSFLGITNHFISDSKLFSAALGVVELDESHTAHYISSQFAETLTKWEIDMNNVVAVVSDNAANIVKGICDLFGKDKHIPCFAHSLNLVCENSIKSTPGLSQLLSKVRSVVTWFKRSVKNSDELRKQQIHQGVMEGNTKKLILDVKTRWNSTFYMCERFIELAPIMINITLSNANAPEMLSSGEIKCLKEILLLLRPFEKMTLEVCAEHYVTLSKIIPMLSCVRVQYEKIFPSFELGTNLKENVTNCLHQRFGHLEKSILCASATILDPRFKQIHFKNASALEGVISHLKSKISVSPIIEHSDEEMTEIDIIESSDTSAGTFDLWDHHKQVAESEKRKVETNEMTQYLRSPLCNFNDDPLKIWGEMKFVYPNLYAEAIRYLGIVATSVPCERLFSKAGATATKERNRLAGKRLSKLLFLHSLPDHFLH